MSTIISRLKLTHPDLGAAGGAGLHTEITTLFNKIGDNTNARYFSTDGLVNAAFIDFDHNFKCAFDDLRFDLYSRNTGSGELTELTELTTPLLSQFTIVATPGFLTTKIRVTNNSGLARDISLVLIQDPINLNELADVDLTVAAEDGQALVYDLAATQWKAGASGDASFKISSVATPNATLKGGYILMDNGKELATYDGAGALASDFGKDLTVSLTTILGSAPANATAYYLYIDLNSLGAAVTQTDTGRSVYAVTVSNFVLSTIAPEFTDMSRYVPRAVIKSATTGTAWSGTGASFATLAFLSAQTVDAKIKSSMTLNYIDNATPERSIGSATTYADAAGVVPVDGTGGAPTVTFTRNTISPIRGVADFKFSKSAVNSQGQGFAIPFTIPVTDKSIKARIKFRVVATNANYVAGDLGLFVYDVTNSLLITPAVSALPNLSGVYETTFDLTTGVSYRLLGHVTSVSALAYDLYFDDVRVDIEKSGSGAVVGPWVNFTPSWNNFTSDGVNRKGSYQRIGSTMHIKIEDRTNTTVSGNINLTIPGGLTADFTAVLGSSVETQGTLTAYDASATALFTGIPSLDNTAPTLIVMTVDSGSLTRWNASTPFIWASTDRISLDVTIPIAEWAGSGTLNTGANDVEYAYNTSTATAADDLTSFGYGPTGALIRAISSSITRRVQFSSPILVTDEVIPEASFDQIKWFEVKAWTYNNTNAIEPLNLENTQYAGIGLSYVNSTAVNQADIYFGSKAAHTGGNAYGAASFAWPATGLYWRVKKKAAGSAVGFGLLTGTASGLMPANLANLDDVAATRMGLKSYSHGTTYNGGIAPTITSVAAGLVVVASRFIPYQMQNGTWRLKGGASCTITANTTANMTVVGITGTAAFEQAVTVVGEGTAYPQYNYLTPAGVFSLVYASNTTAVRWSFDVELSGKPTWAY